MTHRQTPTTHVRVWSQADAERENAAFAEWFKERGYPDYPDMYPLITENAMHAAWQEAARRTALAAKTPAPILSGLLTALERIPETNRGFYWEKRDVTGSPRISAYNETAEAIMFLLDHTTEIIDALRRPTPPQRAEGQD